MGFVHLHVHSDLSNPTTTFDCASKFQSYVDRASELGMHAIACTEHGNLYHWAAKKWYAEEHGLKFIHGIEAYVTKSLEEKVRDNYHVVLLAKNITGLYEINRLASSAFNKSDNHFYYNPRISLDQLLATSENIIILTACLGGILNAEDEDIKSRFLRFLIDHRDRCFLEVQPHQVMDQVEYNRTLAKLSRQYGIRLVATTDVHGLDQRAMDARDIGQRARNTHFDNEDGWTLTFKSEQEMFSAFKSQGALSEDEVLDAMAATETIASMCESYFLDDSIKYPNLFDDPVETLRREAYAAIDTHPYALKYNTREEIVARIDYEVDACAAIGAAQYLLMFKSQSDWEHEHGIFTGPGRGSAAGSEINYLFGITEMNPLRFGLSFDRFINKDRVSLPDIDRDYYDTDRAVAKEHALRDHMGFDKLQSAEIITFGTCQLRKAIDDVCRALDLGLDVAKEIKSEIVMDDDGKEDVPESVRDAYPQVFSYVDSLIGVVVSVGVHAAGVLLTDYDIASYIGLSATKDSPYMASMLDMKELDRLNYIKLDFLGLQNVGLKNKVEQRAGIPRITPDTIDLEDEAVWNSIRDDTTLIFQWESKSASAFLRKFMSDATMKKVRARNKNLSMLKWFSFGNGLLRPACASYRDDVAVGEFYDNGFDELNDFLLQESGHLCMQESIMGFLVEFCGYTKSESDTVRRCVAQGTKVLLQSGEEKPIEEMQIGDRVVCFDGNVATVENVVGVFDNGVSECLKIVTEHGYDVECTASHKFLTVNGWKRADELHEGDFLLTPKKIRSDSDGKKPSGRMPESDAYMLGLLIGDGSLGERWKHISFTNSDPDLIEAFKQCVRQHTAADCTFGVSTTPGKTVECISNVRIADANHRESIVRFLQKHDMLRKSASKCVPQEIMTYPAGGKLYSFLAGLFDTDGGYIIQSQAIEYSSISERLVWEIKSLLAKIGIYSYVMRCKVKGCDYHSYVLRIQQIDSVARFLSTIVPYMRGYKKKIFTRLVNERLSNANCYNYLLPEACSEELIEASRRYDVSLRSVLKTECGAEPSSISPKTKLTDKKARRMVEKLYAPLTYKLLHADYLPVKIKSISPVGYRNVYDLEIENHHNYVSNGLICHNCIAKKKGTETLLPEIENRFVATSPKKYGITEEEARAIIKPFIRVIQDASSYAFSWNHSDPYSFIGYALGYLRYYYPLAFFSVALDLFGDDKEKTAEIIKCAAKQKIRVYPARYGKSGSMYTPDPEHNAVYKGMASIAFMNDKLPNQLLDLARNHPCHTFVEVLQLLNQTSINSRQIGILIELDFFSEFGNIPTLQHIYELFSTTFKDGLAKSISKEKLGDSPIGRIVAKHSRGTRKDGSEAASYTIVDMPAILKETELWVRSLDHPDMSVRAKIEKQTEYMGYADVTTGREEDRRKLVILDMFPLKAKGGGEPWAYKLVTQSLGSGKQSQLTLRKRKYDQRPVKKYDVIYCWSCPKDKRGYFELMSYDVLGENEI